MAEQTTIPPPPSGYTLDAGSSGMEQPIASVRTPEGSNSPGVGDKVSMNGQDAYVTGYDSKGRPVIDTVPPPPAGYTVKKLLPPMTRQQADTYINNTAGMSWAGGHAPGTTSAVTQQPKFGNVALVDPEAPEYGGPIKSSIHADNRGGRNLVPVQDVAATRQRLQYQAANPDEMARVQRSQQMDTSLPLADRLMARSGLEVRKRTELGLATNDVNDRVQNYAGEKGADFAQFLAQSQVRGNGQLSPEATGVVRSIGKNVAQTITNPITYAAAPLGATGKAGQVALSALFATGAAKSSYDAAGQLGSIWDRPDISTAQKAEMATDLVLNTAMAGLAGGHAVKAGILTPSDPILSGLSPEAKMAITRRVNTALSKTGGVISSAASTAGDLLNKLPAAPAEGFIDPRVAVTQRVVDAAPKIGIPKISSADDALQAIHQARSDAIAHHESLAGGDINNLSPDQAKSMNTEIDLLNTMEDHIQAGQKQAIENQDKPQPTRAESLMLALKGAGTAAVGHGAAMAADAMGIPGAHLLLEVAGLGRGGPQMIKGVKGLIGRRVITPDIHDAMVKKSFSGFDSGEQPPFQAADMPAGPDPFAQQPATATDASVQHTSNIAAPSTASGEAQLYPDLPKQFNVSSGSTLTPEALMQRLRAVGQARQTGQVQTSTAYPASVTPQLEPKQIALVPTAQPHTMTIQDIQDAAREANAQKAPGTVDVRAAQTMNADYLGRHGSALDQAKAEWQAQNPGQQVPDWDSGIMRRAGEIDAKMRQGASAPVNPQSWQTDAQTKIQSGTIPNRPLSTSEMKGYLGIPESVGPRDVEAAGLVKRNAAGLWEVQGGGSSPQSGDIFKTPQDMEDWLRQQENNQSNSPMMQKVRDAIQKRRESGDLPGIRPTQDDMLRQDAQIRQMMYEANAQATDTPSQLDLIDQIIRKQNVQPKPFQPGRPLKTSQPPLEGSDLLAGLQGMKDKMDAAKAAAQAAAPGTSTAIPSVQRGATLDSIREALSKPPDPTTASAAQLSALRNELVRTSDPAQRADIQQAIDHLQAVQTGQPFPVIDQATKEGLPASQPRTIEPGTYVRETKQTIPADANIIRANSPNIPANQLQMGDTAFVNPQDVKLDPSRFQFKHNVSERGVTNQFADVKKFDENLAGVIDAYKDPATGELYAVNGHHRTALAQDLNAPRMKVNVMDTQDATEARARGAAKNLAEGRGTGFDAAVFLRDSGLKASDLDSMGISLSDAKVNTALALKNLSSEILDKVGNGTMDEGRGVAIGQATDNPDLQREILNMVQNKEKSGTKLSNDVVASLAKHVVNSPNYETQTQSLFGPQAGMRSLAIEKAQVDAGIIRNLRGEKAAFGAVKSQARAEQLGRAGNVIKPEENRAIADRATQSLELYNRLSQRAGPVNKAVETAAIEMSLGHGTKQTIIDNAAQQIRQILDQEMSGGQARQTGGTSLETPR